MVQVGISPELQERGYKTEKQTSDLLGVAPLTLKAWRVSGKGPRYFKIGRWIFYRQDDLDAWIEGQARVSTSQAVHVTTREQDARRQGLIPERDKRLAL